MNRQRKLAVALIAAALTMSGCTSRPTAGRTAPGASETAASGRPVPSGAANASPEPSGKALVAVADFDRDPCAVASSEELRAALAGPYDLIAANALQRDRAPSTSVAAEGNADAVGCGFAYVAGGVDVSEAYHLVTVRVSRWKRGGQALMTDCHNAIKAKPKQYRAVKLGDEGCLGPGARLSIRIGNLYFTVKANATPGRADPTDEEVRIGTLAVAAATLIARRLPSK